MKTKNIKRNIKPKKFKKYRMKKPKKEIGKIPKTIHENKKLRTPQKIKKTNKSIRKKKQEKKKIEIEFSNYKK
jgi:hypothetical protein